MHVVVHVNNIYLDFTDLPNRYTFTNLIPIPQLLTEATCTALPVSLKTETER